MAGQDLVGDFGDALEDDKSRTGGNTLVEQLFEPADFFSVLTPPAVCWC